MIEVRVSEDGMQAELSICPEEGEVIDETKLREALQLEGIQAGIDDKMLQLIAKNKLYNKFVPVAKGKPPVNGIDGSYEFFFITEEENRIPKILENGSVDYTKTITNVEADDLLAEYHPRTVGTNGYNVFATVVRSVAGKELKPLRCKNVRKEDEKYYAEKAGFVKKEGSSIVIEAVLDIKGDVDKTVGNLDFNGDIHVYGSITSGMTVKAQGSIIVDGVIENAKVEAAKDILIGKGIHGQGAAEIKTEGSLTTNFINHALVAAGGDIKFNYAVSSVILAEGTVTAEGKKASIVGGKVVAREGVDAGTYGNPAEMPTKIYVGVSHNKQRQIQQCKKKLAELEEQSAGYEEDKVPELITKMMADVKAEIDELEFKTYDREGAPIIIRTAIHPGVKFYLNEIMVENLEGRSGIELRNVDSKIIGRRIGRLARLDKPETDGANPEEDTKETIASKQYTVLAIDDDVRMLRTINEMIKSDYKVAVAKGGPEARNYLKTKNADIILLDYMMPEENGVEVLKSLRKNENTAKIPVVFLTGLDDKQKILECLSLKPAGYIVKPVDKEKILRKLKAVLSGTKKIG